MDQDFLQVFTIYTYPEDYPGVPFVVRRFICRSGAEPEAGEVIGTAETIDQARDLIPPTADACIDRSPWDVACIVETWV